MHNAPNHPAHGHGHEKPKDASYGGIRPEGQLADGFSHHFKPLEPMDVTKVRTFSEMLSAMSRTAFGGRNLGEAADVLYEMVTDPDCMVVGTFSGAMTIAKQGLLITDMIDQGMLNAIVSTGALMCHGVIEQTGHMHFRHDPTWDDEKLYEAGYCRVYDTLELEKSLDEAAEIINQALTAIRFSHPVGSHELLHSIGGYLRQHFKGRGILQSASEKGVPVYVPALHDSELGLDVYSFNAMSSHRGTTPIQYDPMRELQDYLDRCLKAKRLGIFTIGGGVPRNWAQQVGPLAELLHRRSGGKFGGMVRFTYAIRICPEPVHWGGLSGCTYSEGVSWGKFIPPEEGGRFAEVHCDATIAWPILVRGVLERMGRV